MDTILLTCANQIATLTFQRTEKLNAFNRRMAKELEIAVTEVKDNPDIRMVILQGAGEAFMCGSDLHEFYHEMDTYLTEVLPLMRHFNNTILALQEMAKPVLASVHGLVNGVGMSLMLASDLVIASEATQFSLGFSRLAVSPIGGVSYNLSRAVGRNKAMEMLLLSENFNVNEMQRLGLINWIVPHEQLSAETQTISEKLVNGPTIAFAKTKHVLHAAVHDKITKQLQLETDAFVKSVKSHDFKTAVRAYINKRQPEFEGR